MMKDNILSVARFLSILSVLLFISGCPNPQNQYAIDDLPGCDDCTATLDEAILAELVSKIEDGDYGNIHSLIIIHNDSLALEEYFGEWTRNMLHPCFSATKSFTSALIGIAIAQGYISGVDETLLSFFPEYDDIENLDERKESITLENVLTMTAGFTWDELSTPYRDNEGNPNLENDLAKMGESDDWIRHMLNLPMSDDPGTEWNYNSGGSHLLSGILQKGSNQSLEDFAEDNLFSTLGITNWKWESDPNEITTGGWGLSLHPVDMAMFGYLFLKNGLLNGEQIVSENWVNISTAKHIEIIDIESGSHNSDYGYQWWRILPRNSRNFYFALGNGGQFIIILPDLNMVVVMTAENSAEDYVSLAFQILFGHIVPAVQEN
jgi:CubicO group peptidase (beta-lactamase class C family)